MHRTFDEGPFHCTVEGPFAFPDHAASTFGTMNDTRSPWRRRWRWLIGTGAFLVLVEVVLRVGEISPTLLHGLSQFNGGKVPDQFGGRILLTVANEQLLPQIAEWVLQQGIGLYEMTPR